MQKIGYLILAAGFVIYALAADNGSKNQQAIEQTKARISQIADRV